MPGRANMVVATRPAAATPPSCNAQRRGVRMIAASTEDVGGFGNGSAARGVQRGPMRSLVRRDGCEEVCELGILNRVDLADVGACRATLERGRKRDDVLLGL